MDVDESEPAPGLATVGPDIQRRARGGSKKGERRGGRTKGTPNRINADLRGMILGALDAMDGQAYFEQVAREDPKTFCALVAKLLPTTLAADPDAPMPVTSIKIELVRPKHDSAKEPAT